jgi:hypothetical protein
MANNATITINDGESTPVAHAFDPVRIDGEIASYQNKVADTLEGRETLTLRLSKTQKVRTTKATLLIPKVVEETVNGVSVYKTDGFATAKVEILIPINWTAAQAKNCRVLASNLLAHATTGLMVDDHEFVW